MIHKYSLKGQYIILDINSGAVHLVDKLLYTLIDYLQPPLADRCPQEIVQAMSADYLKVDILEAYTEILQLYKNGTLFSPDDYGVYAEKMVLSPVKAMCLNVSHDCNLRCEYCFAGKGDYDQGRMVMSTETGIKAIDFLIEQSGERKHLEVDFFGGEPLMNFEVVKQVVLYARSKEKSHGKQFRFTITTNGVLLDDEKIKYINTEMSNVVLSLDGRKQTNDKVRTKVNGTGCYESVLPKFQALVNGRGEQEYYVRGTYTSYNMDFAEDIISLSESGFDQISVEPVVASAKQPYALREEHLPTLFAEYERLIDIMLEAKKDGKSFNFFHYMLDLDQGPCAIKRLRGCGCGNEYVAITPDGDIYPCHQFIGQPDWKMGNLWQDNFNLEMKKTFSQTTVYNKTDCQSCWAKFYCSGGCNANNMLYQGDILKPYTMTCEIEKKRLECAIALKAVQSCL